MASCSKIYYMDNSKTLNSSFLLREIVADCGFVPSRFRLTCITVGDLGIRRLGELGNEHSFWLQFQMDYAEGRGQRDVNCILCTPSHNLEFVVAMHIFLGVDPKRLFASIAYRGVSFGQVNMLRNRYANFSVGSSGTVVAGKSGRDVEIQTFGHNVSSIESGAIGLPSKVLQFIEEHPKV